MERARNPNSSCNAEKVQVHTITRQKEPVKAKRSSADKVDVGLVNYALMSLDDLIG